MLAVIVLGSFAIAIQGRFSFAIVDATDGRRSALPYRFGTSKMYYDCNWRARFATDSPLEEADSNPRSPGPQRRTPYHPVKPFAARRDHRPPSTPAPTSRVDPNEPFMIEGGPLKSHCVRSHQPRIPRHIGGEDRCETAGLAQIASPAARRRPDRKSSRCSAFRRKVASGITTEVMARSRATISRASSSRPIWA